MCLKPIVFKLKYAQIHTDVHVGRQGECVCAGVRAHACVCSCIPVNMHACLHVSMCVCVCAVTVCTVGLSGDGMKK